MSKQTSEKNLSPNTNGNSPENSSWRIQKHPILTFTKGRLVKFYFEGKELYGYENEPIAAALIANGIKVFRITEKMKRPRGFFCAVGKCSSCLMTVNSKPNVMVCVEPLKEGMKVEMQKGRGKLD
ncbi:MAG: (2Fe-2S)-binding protein [candidate division WOR-3 bacterium]|nr:(2Fe-2S)-binding protein [candidate division WOR-3 bacterium]